MVAGSPSVEVVVSVAIGSQLAGTVVFVSLIAQNQSAVVAVVAKYGLVAGFVLAAAVRCLVESVE